MKLLRIILSTVLFLQGQVLGQTNPVSASMGGAGVAVKNFWSVQGNPAGAVELNRASFGVAYQAHYLDNTVNTKLLIGMVPLKKQLLALGFESTGIPEFKELTLSSVYGRSFGEEIRIAIKGSFHQLSITNYGSDYTVTASAGLQADLAKGLVLGLLIGNLGAVRQHNVNNLTIPARLAIGLSYWIQDNLIAAADVEKVSGQFFSTKLGVGYSPIRWLALRAGYNSYPASQSAGIGIAGGKLKFEFAFQYNLKLGSNPLFGMSYEF